MTELLLSLDEPTDDLTASGRSHAAEVVGTTEIEHADTPGIRAMRQLGD